MALYEENRTAGQVYLFRYPSGRTSLKYLGGGGLALLVGCLVLLRSGATDHEVSVGFFVVGATYGVIALGVIWHRRYLTVDVGDQKVTEVLEAPFFRRAVEVDFQQIEGIHLRWIISEVLPIDPKATVWISVRDGGFLGLGTGELIRSRSLAGRLAYSLTAGSCTPNCS